MPAPLPMDLRPTRKRRSDSAALEQIDGERSRFPVDGVEEVEAPGGHRQELQKKCDATLLQRTRVRKGRRLGAREPADGTGAPG